MEVQVMFEHQCCLHHEQSNRCLLLISSAIGVLLEPSPKHDLVVLPDTVLMIHPSYFCHNVMHKPV